MLPSLLKLRQKVERVPWFGKDRRGRNRREQRFRLLRDVMGGIVIFAIVLGGMFVASNGAWPPLIVIESGSMMHPAGETPYGRMGTIDVGDILFVRHLADPRHEVRTWAEGGAALYGRPGDVIEYLPNGGAPAADGSTPTEMNITTLSPVNVGRFVPHHFAVAYTTSPVFGTACGGFTPRPSTLPSAAGGWVPRLLPMC